MWVTIIKTITSELTVILFFHFVFLSITLPQQNQINNEKPSHILSDQQVEKLLLKPACRESFRKSDPTYRIEKMKIPSNGIELYCELYLPLTGNKFPLVILTHGGFNEFDIIMAAPLYEAPILANCGFAALVYHKRGTGKSGGDYANSTRDDFIDDIGNIAQHLSKDPRIDPAKIGVNGGSGGGLNGPAAAARYPLISFVINKSGPVVSGEEAGNYNMENALKSRGYADSLIKIAIPVWKKHHSLWAKRDTIQLKLFAQELIELRKKYDMFLLPSTYNEVYSDTNLIFLRPEFNSAGKDVYKELSYVKAKLLCIYGELDEIVPVKASIINIEKLMVEGGNNDYSVIVLPGVEHSFINPETRRQLPVINIIINWLTENILTSN